MEKAVIIQKPFLYPTKRPTFMSAEMEDIHGHFEKLEKRLEIIHSQQRMTESSINEVKGAVIGNPPMGQKGLAQRMEDLEDRMLEYDKKGVLHSTEKVGLLEERLRAYDKMLDRGWGATKVITAAWVVVGGAIVYVLKFLIEKFFN